MYARGFIIFIFAHVSKTECSKAIVHDDNTNVIIIIFYKTIPIPRFRVMITAVVRDIVYYNMCG